MPRNVAPLGPHAAAPCGKPTTSVRVPTLTTPKEVRIVPRCTWEAAMAPSEVTIRKSARRSGPPAEMPAAVAGGRVPEQLGKQARGERAS